MRTGLLLVPVYCLKIVAGKEVVSEFADKGRCFTPNEISTFQKRISNLTEQTRKRVYQHIFHCSSCREKLNVHDILLATQLVC
jgi:hypothetical protein